MEGLLEHVITNYRYIFCLVFLLPLSIAFDGFMALRNTISFATRENAPQKHDERVRNVQQQVKDWAKEGKARKMCTARPGWQAMSLRQGKYKKTFKNIHLDLHDILSIDEQKQVARVEPMVSMGQLTRALTPLGWTVPVLPELDDLTVGGLVNGVGIETSSHLYGLFQHICTAFEIVLPDGTVEVCSPTKNPKLFYNIPWSHGTLGFLASVELKIIPCKKYVHLSYLPCQTRADAMRIFEQESRKTGNDKHDYVEMLAFDREKHVVMVGTMTDSMVWSKYNPIGRWYKPWFYTHAEKTLTTGARDEYIPLRDYYHRHTRSLFWEVADIIPFGNHWLFRLLLGWTMPPKPSLLKLTQTEALRKLYELHHAVQDMLVPMKDLSDSLDVFERELGIYPLWLCPFRIVPAPGEFKGFVQGIPDDELYVDIGAYGNPTVSGFVAKDTIRRVEDFVRSVNGYQMMYADSYMTREEFRSMFDHSEYDELRKEIPFCEEAFPEVYDKVSKAARH